MSPTEAPAGAPSAPANAAPLLRPVARRSFLIGGGGAALLAGGAVAAYRLTGGAGTSAVGPHSPPVARVEAARATNGRVVDVALTAAPGAVDLTGRVARTWLYNGTLPGPAVRVRPGDRLRATLTNRLPAPTTVHWHGLALRDDMDGVPGVTQEPVAPGASKTYDFIVPAAGTCFAHPHVGMQLDRGLYLPVLVDDPAEPGGYDVEAVLVLDDWVDGLGTTPDALLRALTHAGPTGSAGMADMGALGQTEAVTPAQLGIAAGLVGPLSDEGSPWGPVLGDVRYPLHLVSGRPPTDPLTVAATPGQKVRLRVVNAGADTAYRLAVGGHHLTVVAADGWPVVPVTVDSLLVGAGERYDVELTVGDGAFPLVAAPEGKPGLARAVLRTAAGPVPPADARPAELRGRLLSYADLAPTPAVALPARRPDRVRTLLLTGDMASYRWTLDNRDFAHRRPVEVREGERLRLVFRNATAMAHPMHLHGHTFALAAGPGAGTRKDTVVVTPGQAVAVDVEAQNPGQWMLHCHNLYHGQAGMMTTLSYVS